MLQWREDIGLVRRVELGIALNVESDRVSHAIEVTGSLTSFPRGMEIFAEEEPAEYVYKVVIGAVRFSKLLADGRRQIGAFYLPGDIFGLETDDAHAFSAEATTDSQILVVRKSRFLARATQEPLLLRQLRTRTMEHLQRAQSHMLLLGRKNAQERVAAFLLDLADRQDASSTLDLPMSRQDIGDYLGLTIETVSRTITQFERDGLIAIETPRHIRLRRRSALADLGDACARA